MTQNGFLGTVENPFSVRTEQSDDDADAAVDHPPSVKWPKAVRLTPDQQERSSVVCVLARAL
jgi:hypothetical protein